MEEPKEIVFYLHGVTPDRDPAPHRSFYKQLNEGIRSVRKDWPDIYSGAEWGWNPTGDTSRDQELLSQAQNQLGQRLLPTISNARDFSINPARLALNQIREINFYGFSDMFYYTSGTGKESIRSAIARQLLAYVRENQTAPDSPVRLTLIGHSAGCVIALDLLFHLFHPDEPSFQTHCYVDCSAKEEAESLRSMAQSGILTVRRLFTMGNPLAAMAFRHNRVVESIAAGEKLDPGHYGFTVDPDLAGPRWVNMWDLDDPLAWPVEPLMDTETGTVKDVYVNVSDWITKAHTAYWTSKGIHKAIAEGW